MAPSKSSFCDGRARLLTGLRRGRPRAPSPRAAPARDEVEVGRAVEGAPLPLLLDAQDVGGAAIAGEQVLAVFGVEETAERLDAADDHEEVVLVPATSEILSANRIDEIVARALLAQLDLEPLGDESQQVSAGLGHCDASPTFPRRARPQHSRNAAD